jgi:hypothetical protein
LVMFGAIVDALGARPNMSGVGHVKAGAPSRLTGARVEAERGLLHVS